MEQQLPLPENRLETGRPSAPVPEFRKLVIPFGNTGYIALYRHTPADNTVYIVAFHHQ